MLSSHFLSPVQVSLLIFFTCIYKNRSCVPLFSVSTKFPRSHRRFLWSTARRTRSSTSRTAWRCTNAASALWSRCGWRAPDTMTWSSTDSTWKGSNSLLHTSWWTCRGVGEETKERKKNIFVDFFFFYIQFFLSAEYQFHKHLTLLSFKHEAPLPICLGFLQTTHSMCRSCELEEDTRFSFFLWNHDEKKKLHIVKRVRMEEFRYDTDGVQVAKWVTFIFILCHFFRCLQTIILNGDPVCSWDFLRLRRNSLFTTWTEPSENLHISAWLWIWIQGLGVWVRFSHSAFDQFVFFFFYFVTEVTVSF